MYVSSGRFSDAGSIPACARQYPTKSKEAQNPLAIAGFLYSGLTTYYKSVRIIYDGYTDEE